MKTCVVFDVFITDTPLFPNNEQIQFTKSLTRDNVSSFKLRSRLEITLYTLASFEYMNFDSVLIFYDIENSEDEKIFLDGISSVIPLAKVFKGRSTKGSDFKKIKDECLNCGADFIFYAPNNDHPIICSREIFDNYLGILEKKMDIPNLTLIYSHFQESNFSTSQGSWLQLKQFPNLEVCQEIDDYRLVKLDDGYTVGMQIVHINLFLSWCDLAITLDNTPIKRFDELAGYVDLPEQLSIVPKVEICRHYDSYYHTMFHKPKLPYSFIPPEYVPPLFIPDGFFNSNIKLRVGFCDYDCGFINLTPDADYYPFETYVNKGIIADIKGGLKSIPDFWLPRISEIKIDSERSINDYKMNKNFTECYYPYIKISPFNNKLIVIINNILEVFSLFKRKIKSYGLRSNKI